MNLSQIAKNEFILLDANIFIGALQQKFGQRWIATLHTWQTADEAHYNFKSSPGLILDYDTKNYKG